MVRRAAPSEVVRGWTGRWWTAQGAIDLLAAGDRVLAAVPAPLNPLMDAPEIEVTRSDAGRVALAAGYADHGEHVRLVRDETGAVVEFWAEGTRAASEAGGGGGNG